MISNIDKLMLLYNSMFPKVNAKHISSIKNKINFEDIIAEQEKSIKDNSATNKLLQDKLADMHNVYNRYRNYVKAIATCQNCGKQGYYGEDIRPCVDVNNMLLCSDCYSKFIHAAKEV